MWLLCVSFVYPYFVTCWNDKWAREILAYDSVMKSEMSTREMPIVPRTQTMCATYHIHPTKHRRNDKYSMIFYLTEPKSACKIRFMFHRRFEWLWCGDKMTKAFETLTDVIWLVRIFGFHSINVVQLWHASEGTAKAISRQRQVSVEFHHRKIDFCPG